MIAKNIDYCMAAGIVIIINCVLYMLLPKSDYMIHHLETEEKREAWNKIYKEMMNYNIIGKLVGIFGLLILGKGICK